MISIDVNTKIVAILKAHPEALEAIISISPKFNKLRNPILRKLIATRATIGMASKIGGCSADDFFKKLEPLGFTINRKTVHIQEPIRKEIPEFMSHLSDENTLELDVRPVLDSGEDPFNIILAELKKLPPGHTLKLVNSFEPIPLIQLLEKKGYKTHVETINENLIHTYFFQSEGDMLVAPKAEMQSEDWDMLTEKYKGKTTEVDVREMEMPMPMMTILEALDALANDEALFVFHKRVPLFLLPELKDRKFEYRIRELEEGNVHMLIFKP